MGGKIIRIQKGKNSLTVYEHLRLVNFPFLILKCLLSFFLASCVWVIEVIFSQKFLWVLWRSWSTTICAFNLCFLLFLDIVWMLLGMETYCTPAIVLIPKEVKEIIKEESDGMEGLIGCWAQGLRRLQLCLRLSLHLHPSRSCTGSHLSLSQQFLSSGALEKKRPGEPHENSLLSSGSALDLRAAHVTAPLWPQH